VANRKKEVLRDTRSRGEGKRGRGGKRREKNLCEYDGQLVGLCYLQFIEIL